MFIEYLLVHTSTSRSPGISRRMIEGEEDQEGEEEGEEEREEEGEEEVVYVSTWLLLKV